MLLEVGRGGILRQHLLQPMFDHVLEIVDGGILGRAASKFLGQPGKVDLADIVDALPLVSVNFCGLD